MKKLTILLITVSIGLLITLFACVRPQPCYRYKSRINHISGCDKNERCGVTLEDGTVLSGVEKPMPGQYPKGTACQVE